MKEIKEIREEIEGLQDSLHSDGIHQFTIDWVELFIEEFVEQETGESRLSDETLLGSMAYRLDTLLEIAKADTEDYLIFKRMQEIIEEGRKQ